MRWAIEPTVSPGGVVGRSGPFRRSALSAAIRRLGTGPYRDVVLLGAVATFFALTTPNNRTEAGDAFMFALRVENPEFERPTELAHLAFVPFLQAVFKFFQLLGYSGRAFPIVLGVSAAAAATTVVLVVRLLRNRLELDLFRSLVGGSLVAVSYMFWAYAAEVEVYGLAAAAATGLVYLATSDDASWLRTAGTVTLGVVTVLTHAMFGLVTFVVVPFVYYRRRRFGTLRVYLSSVFILLVLVTYGLFRLSSGGRGDLPGYIGFLLDFPGPATAFGLGWILENAAYFLQTLVGYNFLFAFPAFQRWSQRAFGRFSLEEEFYLGDNTPLILTIAGVVTALTLAVVAMAFVVRALRHRPTRTRSTEAATILMWLITTFAVQMWAGAAETWQMITVPFWVAVVWFTRQMRVWWPTLLAGSLALHNLVGGLGPLYLPSADFFANKSAWIIAESDESDVVGTAGTVVFFRYLRYWSAAEVVHLQLLTSGQLTDISSGWNEVSGDVYLTGDLLDPPALRSLTPLEGSEDPEEETVNYPETYAALVEFGQRLSRDIEPVVTDDFGGVFRLMRD